MTSRALGWSGPLPSNHSFLLFSTRSGKTRLESFALYLTQAGLEVLPPKEWEVLRFRHGKGVGIIHHNKSGHLTWSPDAEDAWLDHRKGIRCRFSATEGRNLSGRSARQSLIQALAQRDGLECVVCGKFMEDPTIEHLLDRKFGGTDHIANLALAHKTCNNTLSQAKTLREKIDLILEKRANVAAAKDCP